MSKTKSSYPPQYHLKCCISDHFWIPQLQKSPHFGCVTSPSPCAHSEQRPWRWELSRRKALRVPVPPRCSRPDPTTTVDSKGWEMFQFQCLRFLSCFIVFKRKKNVWTLNHFNFLYFSNFLSHLLSTLNQSSQFFYCEFFPLKSPFQAPRHMRSDLFGAGVWRYFPVSGSWKAMGMADVK